MIFLAAGVLRSWIVLGFRSLIRIIAIKWFVIRALSGRTSTGSAYLEHLRVVAYLLLLLAFDLFQPVGDY